MLVAYVIYYNGAIVGVDTKFFDDDVDLLKEARSYRAGYPYGMSDMVINVFDEDSLEFKYFDTV